jgi:sugar phosphate isomerase/epimerase
MYELVRILSKALGFDLSLAHLTMIHVSPPKLAAIAGRCGYRYVGLRLTEVTGGDAWPILTDAALLKQTCAELAASGVGVLDVELVRLRPETKVGDYIPMLETAALLGARHVLTQAHDEEWERLLDNFRAFCDLAADYGMTADLEFLTWTKMRGVTEASALLKAANRVNAGLMIDTLHFSRSGCLPEDLEDLPRRWFNYLQISDADGAIPTTTEGLIYTAREDRLLPGRGDLDLEAIVGHIPADLPVAVEIPNSRLAGHMSNDERAKAAYDATSALLENVWALLPAPAKAWIC